jgi:segregation and condensation protein B
MTEDDKLQDSLAAWVPPWRRATAAKPAPADVPAPAEEAAEPAAHGTDSGVSALVGPGDDDYDDEQRPETDVVSGSAAPEVAVADVDRPGPDDDDYGDTQQPETDEFEGVSPEATILEEIDLDIEADDVTPVPLFGVASAPEKAAGEDAASEETAGESAVGGAEPADAPQASGRPADLRGALEAILLVVDEPVPDGTLADVLETTATEVIAELEALAVEYAQARRGFELRRAAGGWRLYTRGDYAAYVERFVLDGQSVRLTQAALETLAVVAYRQPVTRSRMAAIRGVNCDGVVRTLVTRGLIEECGTQPESGAFLYRTTQLFLEKLGLDSIDQLPPLAPFLPDDVNGLVDAER